MKAVQPKVEFITPLNRDAILKRIEEVGRTCYKSEDKITEESAPKFAKMLVKRGHEAMIEHVNITIKFTTDRGIPHEVVRHRLASYAQESSRYCNYSKSKHGSSISVIDIASGFEYDMADSKDFTKYATWYDAMEYAEKAYLKMIELGAPPDEARSVLPTCTKTEIVMTTNLREGRHFIRLRASKHAHPSIQLLAKEVLRVFNIELPELFSDLVEELEYE